MTASGFEEALGHIDTALSLEEAPEGIGRAELLARRGHALRSLGRPEECLTEWRQAIDLYAEAGAVEPLTQLCVDAGYLLTLQGIYDETCRSASVVLPRAIYRL